MKHPVTALTARNKSLKRWGSLLLLPALVLMVGCNDDDNPAAPIEEPPLEMETITEIVVRDDAFSTLEAAVTAAGLAETLNGAGPFTVFAPTNAAFAALPAGTLDALLADPMGDLKSILLYHVVGAKVPASEVVQLNKATTVQGSDVTIEVSGGAVILNGTVKVVQTDVMAENGVIHVIDAVLLPPATEPTPEPTPPLQTIAEIAVGNENFSTLVAALSAAKLVDALKGEGPFTVFAPTNAAFEALPAGTVDNLLKDPEGQLKNILLYHVVGAKATAEDVIKLDKVTTLLDKDVTIEIKDGKVILNGTVMVTSTDILASNGVIHVIDTILLPE